MSSSGERGLSCSAMYHSTPAARPAATIDGKSRVPCPAGASRGTRVRDQILHVQQPDAAGDLADERRPGRGRRPPPSTRRLRGRRPGPSSAEQDVPDRRAVELLEFEGVVVIAEADATRPRRRAANPVSSSANRRTSSAVARSSGGIHGTMSRCVPSAARRSATRVGVRPEGVDALVDCDGLRARPRRGGTGELARGRLRHPGDLDEAIAGVRHRVGASPAGRSRQGRGPCRAEGRSDRRAWPTIRHRRHARTARRPAGCRSLLR